VIVTNRLYDSRRGLGLTMPTGFLRLEPINVLFHGWDLCFGFAVGTQAIGPGGLESIGETLGYVI